MSDFSYRNTNIQVITKKTIYLDKCFSYVHEIKYPNGRESRITTKKNFGSREFKRELDKDMSKNNV